MAKDEEIKRSVVIDIDVTGGEELALLAKKLQAMTTPFNKLNSNFLGLNRTMAKSSAEIDKFSSKYKRLLGISASGKLITANKFNIKDKLLARQSIAHISRDRMINKSYTMTDIYRAKRREDTRKRIVENTAQTRVGINKMKYVKPMQKEVWDTKDMKSYYKNLENITLTQSKLQKIAQESQSEIRNRVIENLRNNSSVRSAIKIGNEKRSKYFKEKRTRRAMPIFSIPEKISEARKERKNVSNTSKERKSVSNTGVVKNILSPFKEKRTSHHDDRGIISKALSFHRASLMLVGGMMLMVQAVSQATQALFALGKATARVEKNAFKVSAYKDTLGAEGKAGFDSAVERYVNLTGSSKGQAGGMLAEAFSAFSGTGLNLDSAKMNQVVEMAYGLSQMSPKDISPEDAILKIQGLAMGNISGTEAGIANYEKGKTVEESLNKLLEIFKKRPLYDSMLREKTQEYYINKAKSEPVSMLETIQSKYSSVTMGAAQSLANVSGMLFGGEENAKTFAKLIKTVTSVFEEITEFASVNSTMQLLLEFVGRFIDLMGKLWIIIQPLVDYLLTAVNEIMDLLQRFATAIAKFTIELPDWLKGIELPDWLKGEEGNKFDGVQRRHDEAWERIRKEKELPLLPTNNNLETNQFQMQQKAFSNKDASIGGLNSIGTNNMNGTVNIYYNGVSQTSFSQGLI